MSGLYLIVVVLLWSWLTWQMLRFCWRLTNQTTEMRRTRMAFMAGLVVTWLAVSFWYGGGRIYYYDWKVRQLCAIDGGIKVYETVELPMEMFDKWGNVHIPDKQRVKLGDEYYSESETMYLRLGEPTIVRMLGRTIRVSDKKVLGESVYYGRGGGYLPGPWQPSGFTCPDPVIKPHLESSIFRKEASK